MKALILLLALVGTAHATMRIEDKDGKLKQLLTFESKEACEKQRYKVLAEYPYEERRTLRVHCKS